MEDAGQEQQQQQQPQAQAQAQSQPTQVQPQPQLMTKLSGLTPSNGTTTLIHRSGHCYQLHRPHLALPPDHPTLESPHKKFKADPDSPSLGVAATAAAAAGVDEHDSAARRLQHQQHLSPDQLGQQQQHHHQNQQQHQQQQNQQQQHHHHHQQSAQFQLQHPLLGSNAILLRQQQQQQHQHQITGHSVSHILDGLGRHVPSHRQKPAGLRQQPANTSTHISNLYPEILALIFSNLDVQDRGRAAQVCVAWREAAYHRSAWRGVEAKLHLRSKHSSAVFNCLERRGIKRVQVLSLTVRRGLVDVFRGVPKLQSLNLSGCYNMSDAGLNNALSPSFPSLTELNLSLCKNITDLSLNKIARCLKNLESLELGGCQNITNMGLHVISWGLKKLKRLDLRSCWHISDQGISYLADINNDNFGNHNLEHLGLQDCQRLSDECLRHLATGLSGSLKSINLSFCALITDSGMKHVAKIASLRELDLRSCDNISEIGMAYLAEGGSRISSLDVSFCDKIGDSALQHISQGLFNLKSLSMSNCPITDEGIAKIARTQKSLEILYIGQCSRLTDRSVFTIVESMPDLRCIDLYGCTRISKSGLDKIDKLRVALNLRLWQERR